MNRIHRIIFNRALGEYRVASEHAKGRGKSKALACVATGLLALLVAAPAQSIDIKNDDEKRVGGTEFWSAWPELNVGNGTDGTLVIEDQGEVESAWGRVGTAGATGRVTVADQGTYWVDELTIGNYGSESQPGTGILTVANGGTIDGVSGYIGNFETAQGMAEITGAGSLWAAVNDVTVGRHGAGTLKIADGGKVDSGAVYIGYGETGSGRISVESGGILETGFIEKGEGSASVSFDGGILRAANDEENFMRNFGDGDVAIGEGGVFIDSNGHDIGIAAAVSGPGDLTKIGAGALTLTGNNAVRLFSVDEGTLRIDEGGALRDQGWISGEHHYIGTQAGTPAELIVASGTLSAETSFEIADAPGTIAGLSISGEDAQANLGLIGVGDDGTGRLVVENGGRLSVSSAYIGGGNFGSTGTGSLSVSGEGSSVEARYGIVVGQSASAPGSTYGDGSTGLVVLSEGGKLTSGSIGLGQQNADGSARLVIGADSVNPADAIGAGILDTSEIRLYSDAASVNFNHTNSDYLFSTPLISRSGSVPLGPGALNHYAGTTTLTGDSSGFLGATTVYGGTLRVGDASGRGSLGGTVEVRNGATLGGSGTVGSGAGSQVTVASGGTLAPGNSIGTLTVDGDLTFEAGSRFEVEVDPQGAGSDQVAVTGDTTIKGGSVAHVGATGQYDLRSAYTLLTTGGTLSGKFDTVASDFAFLTPELVYDYGAGMVGLNLARNDQSFASVALTGNQRATAGGIESIGLAAGHAVYDAIAQLPDDAALVRASLDALSGEIHASAKAALIEDSRFVRDAATGRVRAAFAAPGASTTAVSARTADGTPITVSATHYGPVVWSQAFGSWGSTDGDGNAASLDRNVSGMLIGADRAVGDWRVGALAGYSYSDFDASERASSGHSSDYHLGLYGGTQWGALGLRTGLAYTWHDIDTRRSVAIPGLNDSLRADYGGGTLQAFGELGYGVDLNGTMRLEPFAGLAHVRLHTDGYDEDGGDAALSADSANTETTFSTLGLRAEYALSVGAMQGVVRAMAGWRHAMGDTRPQARHAFSAGSTFTVAGVPIARDSAVLRAGIDVTLSPGATFGLSYTGQIAGSARDNGVTASLAVAF